MLRRPETLLAWCCVGWQLRLLLLLPRGEEGLGIARHLFKIIADARSAGMESLEPRHVCADSLHGTALQEF